MKLPHSNIWKLFIIKGGLWFMIIMPVIILFFQDNGLNMMEIMSLQACYSASLALAEIPSGYAADLLGRKKTLVLGCILSFLGFSLFSIAYSFWWFLAAEIILGLGNSFISGADTALMYDTLLEMKLEKKFLKYEGRSISIGNFSEAIAGIIGGSLAAISFRYPAYAQVLISFFIIPFAVSLKEPKMQQERMKKSWKSILEVMNFSLRKSKVLRTHIFYSSGVGMGTLMMAWLAQPFLKELGVEMKHYGLLWALLNVVVGLVSYQAHRIENKFSEFQSLFIVGFLCILCYLLISFNINVAGFGVLLIFYANRGYATPLLRNHINRHTPSNVRATVMSIRSLIIRMSFALIAPWIGWVADQWGLNNAFLIMGFLVTGIAVFCLSWFYKNKNELAHNK
jgi:MFS family permease